MKHSPWLRTLPLVALFLGSLALAQPERLVVAQGTDAVSLDANNITDSPSATVGSHITETLFSLEPDGSIIPWLVEDYEVAEDGLTWTLNLREGVTFHDGTPFDAEAVRFNIERLTDPDNAFQFAFLLADISNVEVTGDLTVELQLEQEFAPLLAHLTHNSTGMQSPTAIEEAGEDYGSPEVGAVGTGPYQFVAWEPGQHIDLSRFDDYWGDAPAIAEVRFRSVPEATTRIALVETGEAHVAVRIPPQDIARLSDNAEITIDDTSSVRTIYIYFNHTEEPFTDERVRQAVNYAVDKDEIVEFVLGGVGRVSDAPISPGVFGYSEIGNYSYDPERARELLAEAGYEDGFSTTLYSPSGRYFQDIQVTEAIQSQLAEVGIEAEIETLEWATYLEVTEQPAAENTVPFAMLGWGTVTGDADYGLFALFHTSQHVPEGSNRSFYSNEQVDDLLTQARTTSDQAAREELYQEAMTVIWEDAPWLFLHSERQITAIRDEVEGIIVHPTERVLVYQASFR